MKRPSEHPLPGVPTLNDKEALDFAEQHRVALILFVDLEQETSIRMRGRVNMIVARHALPNDPKRFGAAAIDIAQHRGVAEALDVRSVPTLVVFVDGEIADRLSGLAPESVLDDVVNVRLNH